jgi:hypothetical protein
MSISHNNEPPCSSHSTILKDTLAILTLKRHEDGIWIKRLVEALDQQQTQAHKIDDGPIRIQVVVLEELLQGPFFVSEPQPTDNVDYDISSFHRWRGLVNRISDAADTWEVKACLAILQLAKQIWKIPIWNGPDAYSLCTHKWCHHVLFQQARLHSPPTVVALQAGTDATTGMPEAMDGNPQEKVAVYMLHSIQPEKRHEDSSDMVPMTVPEATKSLHYLIKPNAGGFGAGIERRQAKVANDSSGKQCDPLSASPRIQWSDSPQSLPTFSDRFVLFQNYIQPQDGKIYRVWFLRGKVQCAVERHVDTIKLASDESQTDTSSTEEFTSGCVGVVCQRRATGKNVNTEPSSSPPHIQPWTVPESVRVEIENLLAPVLPQDAHCGSVEFMYSSTTTDAPERLYFDLNLLSTLPVDVPSGEVEFNTLSSNEVPDPWLELASAIWTFIKQS